MTLPIPLEVPSETSPTAPQGRMADRRQLCLSQLVAATSPDSIASAVPATGQTMSYGESNAPAGRLSRHLVSLGVGPEVVVAICLERSFEYVIAELAAWKAGGAYLPIDPTWPASRREAIIADAGAHVLIAQSVEQTQAAHVIDLDRHACLFTPSPVAFKAPSMSRDLLAYVHLLAAEALLARVA